MSKLKNKHNSKVSKKHSFSNGHMKSEVILQSPIIKYPVLHHVYMFCFSLYRLSRSMTKQALVSFVTFQSTLYYSIKLDLNSVFGGAGTLWRIFPGLI